MGQSDKRTPEQKKADIRAALDVLQNYVGDDGKIDARKLTQRIAELEQQLVIECEAKHKARAEMERSTFKTGTQLLREIEQKDKHIAEIERDNEWLQGEMTNVNQLLRDARAEERERLLARVLARIDYRLNHYRKNGNQCIHALEYLRDDICALGDE